MRQLALLGVFLVASGSLAEASEKAIDRVRGIPLDMKAFYDAGKPFKCLDGSMSLPFAYVNDDYCDCPDGSDEPGTSACPKMKFHCINLMHSTLDIPSSRVNDGLCDCCDGSDEYSSGASCPNTCEMLGRAAREEAKRREELITQGGKLRKSMVDEGKQRVSEAKQKVDELSVSVEAVKKEKEEADELRKQAEAAERTLLDEEAKIKAEKEPKPEDDGGKAEVYDYIKEDKAKAEDAFNSLDTNEDGLVTLNEIMEFNKFDQNKDGIVSQDEAKFFLAYREEVDMEEFVSTSWPLIKPVWLLPPPLPIEAEQVVPTPTETEEEVNGDIDPEDTAEYDDLEAPPVPTEPVEERDPAVKAAVDAADAARLKYHEAERKHKEVEQELNKYQDIVDGDFGDESEFAPLRGECFEMTEKEYVYKVCPFDKCSQQAKSGGSETSLGRWGRWETMRGNKYAAMKFEGGLGCWNGPARTTLVILQCGLTNQLISATEPSRCEYQFEFATPAACTSGMPVSDPKTAVHEEL